MQFWIPFAVAVVGGLMYGLGKDKVAQFGLVSYLIGGLVTLLNVSGGRFPGSHG